MTKLNLNLTVEHYKNVMWYMKAKGISNLSELTMMAIDWFDPEIHGPFVYGVFTRVDRVIELNESYMEAIITYSHHHEMSDNATVSTVVWLYCTHHEDEMKDAKLETINQRIPLNLLPDMAEALGGTKGISAKLNDAILKYVAEGKYLHRKVVGGERQLGVRRVKFNPTITEGAAKKLMAAANHMKTLPTYIAADALAEYLTEEEDAEEIF